MNSLKAAQLWHVRASCAAAALTLLAYLTRPFIAQVTEPLRILQRKNYVYGSPLALCPGGMGTSTIHVEDILKLQSPGLTIDVGAHDGTDTLMYAGAGHTVLSFEPSPSKVNVLLKRFQDTGLVGHRIHFYPVALSDQQGSTVFHVFKNTERQNFDKGVGSQQDMIDKPPTQGFSKVHVRTDILDTHIGDREVLWLKIDAQGHDAQVLMGAKKALAKQQIAALSFEVSPKLAKNPLSYVDALRYLNDCGYRCHDCRFFKYGLRGKTAHVQKVDAEELIFAILNASKSSTGKYTEIVCYPG